MSANDDLRSLFDAEPQLGGSPLASALVDVTPRRHVERTAVIPAISAVSPAVAPSSPDPPDAPAAPAPTHVEHDSDWDDLEAGFESILNRSATEASAPTAADIAIVESLFKEIAVGHLGPMRDFVVELAFGDASPEWFRICIPAVATLKRSAEDMGMTQMAIALTGLLDALRAGQAIEGSNVTDPERSAIMSAYDELVRDLPEVADAAKERDRREPIVVQALLRQVPGVRDVALDKLFSSGLTGIEMYYRARPREIAETSGIPVALAEAIVAHFRSYRDRHASIPPESKRMAELAELADLAREIERHNRTYENGASGWTNDAVARRRQARKERGDAVLKVSVLLARLGEVDLVSQLERMPFERKVETIDAFVAAARAEDERAKEGKRHE